MGWIRPALKIITGGLYRDKDLNLNDDGGCPWKGDCPQHVYTDKIGRKLKREVRLPTRVILEEQIQPMVRLYKCRYCGMRHLVGLDGQRIPHDEQSHLKNPALIGGRVRV